MRGPDHRDPARGKGSEEDWEKGKKQKRKGEDKDKCDQSQAM